MNQRLLPDKYWVRRGTGSGRRVGFWSTIVILMSESLDGNPEEG